MKAQNYIFLSHLPPEIASQILDPDSLPSWAPSSPHASDYTMDSNIVEPPLSRDEPMDVE